MIELDLNEEFVKAFHLAENTEKNLFITGKAGTGKSTFLNYFRENTTKDIAVIAPTGVAAVNVKGQTIHSFFNFKPDITLYKVKEIKPKNPKLYKKLDCIVIDEISMVRADILDCIDSFLRIHGPNKKKPFGGIQMI
ncbi:AAA family ATPase, partial [Thermodesulfovibrio yellowstonii]|uniref:AAA family ATPase n=1 Tax=Thermodesulfovibrio yellowstonii TaxID=28262 RepID=UPI0024B3C774